LARVFGRDSIAVNSSHHQAIDRLARGLHPTATSPDGLVEAVELADGLGDAVPYMISVQFHPERLVRRYPEFLRLFSSFTQACRSKPERKQ
jgi:putative glutamine amidotransferase